MLKHVANRHVRNTGFHANTEVKQHRTWTVAGWETDGDCLPHLAWVQIPTPVRGGADSVQPGLPTGGYICMCPSQVERFKHYIQHQWRQNRAAKQRLWH